MTDFRKLPNLTALRAFEAAARYQNFSRAAEEIHVTHGAISHQVRALEEELGVALFKRHGKRLVITEEGRQFAAALRKALLDIAQAADTLRAGGGARRLTISSLASFAARWLTPRLGRFIELHPDIEVNLQASNLLTDFGREPVDVAIRFGGGSYPGLWSELVMEDFYIPVASPRFNGGRLPERPCDLGGSALLRCHHEPWAPWFRAARVDLPEPGGGILFEDAAMLIRAAIEGHGIALARHAMVASELASGELVRLFEASVRSPYSYYLVCPPQALERPQVQAFRTWLLMEAERTGQRPQGT